MIFVSNKHSYIELGATFLVWRALFVQCNRHIAVPLAFARCAIASNEYLILSRWSNNFVNHRNAIRWWAQRFRWHLLIWISIKHEYHDILNHNFLFCVWLCPSRTQFRNIVFIESISIGCSSIFLERMPALLYEQIARSICCCHSTFNLSYINCSEDII